MVISREEITAKSPAAEGHTKVKVNVFTKGERIVQQKDISVFRPTEASHSRKPKTWKTAMLMAMTAKTMD